MKQIINLITPTLSIIAFLFCIIIGEYTISMILLIVLIFSLFNNFKNLIK